MTAIFDFRHTRTSDCIPISLSVLPDRENMGIAVGISLLSCMRAEIYVIFCLLPVNSRHLDFRHTQTSDSIFISLFVLPDPENMGVAVEISLLSLLKAEIHVIS